ncbi:11758_t:CDS:2 [Ambispora gerdemannii]|uniref:Box C/D snoRNA protein 1 n=1 Tax=Ambispora gerdemannii TaxID=144530 RepID=A0A9N8YN33_9GLOM|nr:11758_t:CDS:2 [Ambispora gerdemannii]
MAHFDPLSLILEESNNQIQELTNELATNNANITKETLSPAEAATKRATTKKRALSPPLSLTKCQGCNVSTAKYKCPRCRFRTCSLACSRKHKEIAKCNGIRSKTHYVPRENYGYQELMLDYTYLEGVSRTIDVSERSLPEKYNSDADRESHKRYHQDLVYKAAHRRGINYFSMHRGMKRNQMNTSRFIYQTLNIIWQVEWIFPELENQTIYHRISEKKVLSEALKESIIPRLTASEQTYFTGTNSNDYDFFLKLEKQPSNNITYFRVNPNSTLLNSLKELPKNPGLEEVRTLDKNDPETSKGIILQNTNIKDANGDEIVQDNTICEARLS